MKRDIIFIFLGGGAMPGIFSAGVVSALQDLNLYPKIHGIYAVSSRAHSAAYFLARESKFGSKIHTNELSN